MTMEIVQTNDGVNTEVFPEDNILDPDPMITYNVPSTESAEESWEDFQAKVTSFFADLPENATAFFRNNRQPINTLGLILLAFLGVRVLFAVLGAIDDIPLMAFVLKLVGFVYLVQFVWRYLMRASDRQELAQKIETVKADVLGNQS
jgi:CAAD domains of cyanobacterial aminoacyl-tRNA synthetase